MKERFLKNKMLAKLLAAGVVFLLSFLLGGCQGSNNLADPIKQKIVAKCTDISTAVTCVSGRFIADGAVENLDYECGTDVVVEGVTLDDGSFSCPVGSTAIFSLTNPDDKAGKKIILGSVTVLNTFNFKQGGLSSDYFNVTPSSLSVPPEQRAEVLKNIVRLLESFPKLREEDNKQADFLSPARSLKITDADKRKLTLLSQTMDASKSDGDFISDARFSNAISPYMSGIARTLISDSTTNVPNVSVDTSKVLKKAIYSTVSGFYSTPGTILGALCSTGTAVGVDFFCVSASKDKLFWLSSFYNLIDREGRMFGYGVFSTNASPTTSVITQCQSLQPDSSCTDVTVGQLSLPATNVKPWYMFNDQTNEWLMSYQTSSELANTTMTVKGSLDRGVVVATTAGYSSIFGTDVPTTAQSGFGTFSVSGARTISSSDGKFSALAYRNAAPTLNPDLWTSTKVTFPMNIEASFYDNNNAPMAAKLYFTIFEDGNIISNLTHHCGDPTKLSKDLVSLGRQEYPLGIVSTVFASSNKQLIYLNPIIIVPNHSDFDASIRGLAIGAYSATAEINPAVRIRINGDSFYYLHSYQDVQDVSLATDIDKTASWYNPLRFYSTSKALRDTSTGVFQSQKDPNCP